MPVNTSTIIVLDWETSSADAHTTQPLSLGSLAVNPRSLEIIPNSEFYSLIKPSDPDKLEPEAMAVNKLNIDELMAAPSLEVVWADYVKYVNRWNYKKTSFTAPRPAGFNIRGFDLIIMDRMCKEFGPTDKKGDPSLFNYFGILDFMDDAHRFFDDTKELPNKKFDTIRDYLGLSKENAHNALVDCRQEGAVLCRFLKMYRNIFRKGQMKGAFADV